MNKPRVKIEIDPNMEGCEVTIRCAEIDENVARIQKLLKEAGEQHISFFKDEKEFFFPLADILFFEAEEGSVRAHTETESFEVRSKLYELEESLPSFFLRISKSAILNVKKVYSITKNLPGARKVELMGTHKTAYCSRNYYRSLMEKMNR